MTKEVSVESANANQYNKVRFEVDDVLSEDLLKDLEIEDGFIWIENTSEINNKNKQIESNNTYCQDVAQHDYHEEVDKDTEGSQILHNDSERKTMLNKELLVEQLYWEQFNSSKKYNILKPRHNISQRKKLKELNIIANGKSIPRKPSFYQFDKSTTDILEMLLHKHVGPYYNVVGMGEKSVVLYAHCPLSAWFHFIEGHAVKVYKLTSDASKNSVVLKKVQREYDHLNILRNSRPCYVPIIVHKYRNVTVMNLIGNDQEPAPSITSLPLEQSHKMYDKLIELIGKWYKLKIVHGKLSTHNVRYYGDTGDQPRIIGWSHSVGVEHPTAPQKLMRDCHFVTKFFARRNVPVKSTEELFKSITGVEKISRKLQDMLRERDLWRLQYTNPNRSEGDLCRPNTTSRFK